MPKRSSADLAAMQTHRNYEEEESILSLMSALLHFQVKAFHVFLLVTSAPLPPRNL
eukprot:gene9215-8292_t